MDISFTRKERDFLCGILEAQMSVGGFSEIVYAPLGDIAVPNEERNKLLDSVYKKIAKPFREAP